MFRTRSFAPAALALLLTAGLAAARLAARRAPGAARPARAGGAAAGAGRDRGARAGRCGTLVQRREDQTGGIGATVPLAAASAGRALRLRRQGALGRGWQGSRE